MKKVTVLGWYGHDNAGDESYKHSFPLFLPGANLTFTDSLTEEQKKTSDLIILGGGAVLEPAFLQQLQSVKKPKYIVSATATKSAPKELLADFKQIIVRDVKSQDTLKHMGINADLVPDLAFLLKANKHAGYDYLRKAFEGRQLYEKVVVIVFNSHLNVVENQLARDAFHFHEVVRQLSEIIDNTPASFVFVPFGQRDPWDDRVANSWLASKCKFWKKNIVVYDRINFQTLLNIVACADAVISTRLHASIFGCIANVPFVDITHHDKNLGFLQTIGKTDWSLSYWKFESTKCESLLRDFFMYPDKYKEELKQIVASQKKAILECNFRNKC